MKAVYLLINDSTEGPFKLDEVKKLITDGSVAPETLWAESGGQNWRPLAELPGLELIWELQHGVAKPNYAGSSDPAGSHGVNSKLIGLAVLAVILVVPLGLLVSAGGDGFALFGGLLSLLLIPAGLGIYFIPSLVAWSKNRANTGAILALNLLAGWTFVGWVIALVWALTEQKR